MFRVFGLVLLITTASSRGSSSRAMHADDEVNAFIPAVVTT